MQATWTQERRAWIGTWSCFVVAAVGCSGSDPRGAGSGAHVLIAEKNRRPGVKILMSGGTRCNLTNARGLRSLRGVSGPIDPEYDPRQALGARSIQQAFGANGAFLGPALKALSVEESVALFESEGVPVKIEANGKVFPASDRATDVLEALLARLRRSGAVLRCGAPVGSVEQIGEAAFVAAVRSAVDARASLSRSAVSLIRDAARSATGMRSPVASAIESSSRDPRWCRSAWVPSG